MFLDATDLEGIQMTATIDVLHPERPKRVLLVVANPAASPTTGWPVGFWWAELTHPYWEFVEHGYEVTLASPEGGAVVADGFSDPEDVSGYSAHDLLSLGFKKSPAHAALLEQTVALSEVDVDAYDAVFLVGGQSPMVTFRGNEKLKEITGEREGPLGRSLYLARPIKITDQGCLSCHTTPEIAPASVVKAYGSSNGYGWKLNEIIGAQIVTVPMAVPFQMAQTAFRTLLASLVGVFVFILVFLNILLWFVVIRPIKRLSSMADAVSTGNLDVPAVPVSGHDEVAALAGSFNRMRISLGKALKMLEDE